MFHECSDKEPILAIPISPACQDAVVPFPWSKSSGPRKLAEKVGPVGHDDAESSRPTKVLRSTALKLDDFPWYSDLARPCQELGCIRFQVPKSGSSAGSVLRHSQSIMESIFRVHDPCIFKIGWTHCPAWRWSNKLYGYAGDRDGWSDMVVLFVSHEPYSPAMLEAALIDKHFSDSALLIANLCRAGRKLVFFVRDVCSNIYQKWKTYSLKKQNHPDHTAQVVLVVEMWSKVETMPFHRQLPRRAGMLHMLCTGHSSILLQSQSWKS